MQVPFALKAELCVGRGGGKEFLPWTFQHTLYRWDWESTLETQGHISMPGGSLKPQLSGWRSEAGGVSLTAVSLLVKPSPKPAVHRGFADGCFGALRAHALRC